MKTERTPLEAITAIGDMLNSINAAKEADGSVRVGLTPWKCWSSPDRRASGRARWPTCCRGALSFGISHTP